MESSDFCATSMQRAAYGMYKWSIQLDCSGGGQQGNIRLVHLIDFNAKGSCRWGSICQWFADLFVKVMSQLTSRLVYQYGRG